MTPSRFDLVIFDCDGVLVDSEPIINRAHSQVLAACGYPIAEMALVDRFCGMSDPEMLDIIFCNSVIARSPQGDVAISGSFCDLGRQIASLRSQ